MAGTIQIEVNGFQESVPENATISQLISLLKEQDVHLVVELNGRFVYPQQYEKTNVSQGDTVEFINPDFGG
jgi:sulfur carrier protein